MKKLIKQILKETVDNRIVDVLIKMNLTSYKDIKNFLEEAGYDENEIKEIFKTIREPHLNKVIGILQKKYPNPMEDLFGSVLYLKGIGFSDDEISKIFKHYTKEIYSNYFKSISGLKLTPSNWMNFYFSPDQLEIVKSEYYPKSIFFKKDGKVVIEQDKKTKQFLFDYDEIWLFFEFVFGMKYHQKEVVLSSWVEDTFNLKGYTASLLMKKAL